METTLNFEKVWQLFQETDRKFQESQRALDHRFQAIHDEFQETQRALDRKFRETDKKMQALQELFEGQWDKLMESLVEGDLVNLLKGHGIRINDTSTRRKGCRGGENYEFDIIIAHDGEQIVVIAHDGEQIVVVEVKTTLRLGLVDKFIDRLHRAKDYMPEYATHTVFGAVAYLRAEQGRDRYAQKQNQGLFVTRATGDSATIVNPAGFQPRKFG